MCGTHFRGRSARGTLVPGRSEHGTVFRGRSERGTVFCKVRLQQSAVDGETLPQIGEVGALVLPHKLCGQAGAKPRFNSREFVVAVVEPAVCLYRDAQRSRESAVEKFDYGAFAETVEEGVTKTDGGLWRKSKK